MSKKPCTHEYLANNRAGTVLTCRECGIVHLHLQNLSLRFDTEQFTELSALTAEAAKKMQQDPEQAVHKRPTLTIVH
ncbi:DUF6686 family protein [Methylosarcina fibrata]|uniref:DUF6686 family protein n=1 Tax=Methylosarcina fibrata TaxID=105972 RepID=UPI0003781D16|nr:DUF6686 family protein [Methylosarcina fibrata]